MEFNQEFQAKVSKLEYDFKTRAGTVFMPAGACCDLTGCTNFFERLDKDCIRVATISGRYYDVIYIKTRGKWESVCLEPETELYHGN